MTPITTVRLPPALRAEAESYAHSVGCSLNGLVGIALRDYLDARRAVASPAASVQASPVPPPVPAGEVSSSQAGPPRSAASKPSPAGASTGRKGRPNDPCWCGSGKKFKKCHGVQRTRK